jgi:hypothetical protein
MKKEVRRIVMFCTILTVGLLLLFIDVTLIQLLFLIIAIAIILPFLLGLVTIAEVRTTFETIKEQKLKKISLLKKLDDIKLFEKKGPAKPEIPVPKAPAKSDSSTQKSAIPAAADKSPSKMPFSSQIQTIVSSLKSFGSILKERTKRERKVSDINKMLDTAVSEKVEKKPAATGASPAGDTSLPAPGGVGSASAADTDPFLSLSGDEFDAGLLDGLDDDMMTPGIPSSGGLSSDPGASPDMGLPEPELSSSDSELDSAAADILKAHGGGEDLDEFSGLEPGEGTDTDFGDLDNLSLDDVDLEGELGDDMDTGGNSPEAPTPAEPATSAAQEPAGSPETSSAVKTTWIPSDAPKGADQQEDQIGTQADMASFASASSGSDEDLLSSIASDVKHVTKEKDLSLLRELKDFKAPANEIETELTDMYQKMSTVQKPKDKIPPATNGIK